MKKRSGFDPIFVLMLVVVFFSAQLGVTPARALGAQIFVNDDVNDGLAAHWKFDEAGSTTALDFLGANPAALQDTASQSNASLPALAVPNPTSLALDGINDYAQINAPSVALALSASFSLTAWVRRTTTGTYDAIYDSGTQANKWWVFIADNSGTKNNAPGFGIRGVLEVYSTQSITDANWHHIAVVKSGNTGNNLSFFVDGAAAGTAAVGTVSVPAGSARIGVLLDGILAAQFSGNLDDLRIYNRALSAAEVGRLAGGQGCVTDGATWANAFRELQCALSSAGSGQEIWLAGGIYHPGTARDVSYNLVNGVNLLGGFAGNETLASQRPAFDPNAPLTIMSGDLLGNDVPAAFLNYADNSQSVVIAGPGVGATLDGMAIRQGSNDAGGGQGAGLQIQAGALGLTLKKVVVSGNSANSSGGGISSQAPLTLTSVTFNGNRSLIGNGGGLFSTAAVNAGALTVLNNTAVSGGGIMVTAPLILTGGLFDGNRATTFSGGAIESSANLTVNGVSFNNNQAPFGGGAIESSGAPLMLSNDTFTNNRVTTFTGGAVESFSSATVQSSNFIGNTAVQDGGAIFVGSSPLTVDNSTFSLNKSTGGNCLPVCSSGSGGAIATVGDLLITNSTFTLNTARLDGGAIAARGTQATISSTTLSSNQAGSPANAGNPGLGRGGAVFSAGTLTLNNVIASLNSAQASGGGINAGGTLISVNGVFESNSATSGGGIFAENGGTLTGSTLLANIASNLGGGMTIAAGTFTLNGCTFSGNNAQGLAGQGGGLNITAGAVTINGGSFSGNSAAKGGGLFNGGTLVTISAAFDSNTAATAGGGIFNAATMIDSASDFTANQAVDGGGVAFGAGDTTTGHGAFGHTVFTNNTATHGGGLNSISDVSLNSVTFTGNQATGASGDGGGMFTSGGVSSLTGVTFSSNTAGRFGGGARLSAAIIQRSTFAANTAGLEGGALLLSSSSEVTASIFNANTSSLSGALSMQGPVDRSQTLRVINSLFYDNQRISTAGAADMRLFDLTITLANNTFARPGAAGQRSVDFFRSNLAAENNIWSGYQNSLLEGQTAMGITLSEDYNLLFNAPLGVSLPAGAHNLTADPQFADPANNNFQLKISSPAIDSGDKSILPIAVLTDLGNLSRFIDVPGVPNTGAGTPPVDRGAYEFPAARVYIPLVSR